MMTKLLLSGFACCSLLTADFSAPAWRYRRPLSVTPPVPVSEFTVDASLCRDSAANLDDLRILIEPELTRRQLKLSWRSSVAGTVDVAATETRQIALNLLLNACEASRPGSEVGFQAWVGPAPDHAGLIELNLEVVDSGPGLPKAVAAALTEIGVTDPSDPPPRTRRPCRP